MSDRPRICAKEWATTATFSNYGAHFRGLQMITYWRG
jgi:hypothetical protein